MGASSSGLLDETKISNIKGLVDSAFQNFSVLYCQQYAAAYFGHLHQEVEPKKEGRGLLLSHRSQYNHEEVLYQGCVKFSCWDEQGKKGKEKYIVLRRDYKVGIHENMEAFSRGCAAKLVLQTAGGSVFTTEKESRAHLEHTCAGILNEVKEDSSSVASSPDVFAVYLHLPYTGYTCFLFQQEEERDHFLSALKTCIRHCNIDPWCDSSYESQAYVRALQLYRQDKGCYESWEMLLGTEEKVLATQVMEEVLPWLQSQLQSKVKGKKTERIRQWLTTVQATYTLVLEQLTASLEALREECRQTASANQALIRSNLDQIMSSHCFLQEKVRACICEEAEKVCSESVAPYLSSVLEVLTENISAGIQGMQRTLHTQMDSAFTQTNGGTGETGKALSTLHSISLDHCYRQVENLTKKLEGLKQRFGLNSTQRLLHSTHLEMEKLLDSAVYTLELFLQTSAKLQPSQIPVKMERAKERVLKQLDYDSRVVQRRLYQETLLEITLPALTRRMDSKMKTELQQFEQYIFSDYSSFVLVHNVYDDVLRNILSKQIETAVQDAASAKTNNLLLDTSDLAISQYSLLGQTPPRSAPDSPSIHARDSSSAAPGKEAAPVVKEEGQTVTADVCLESDRNLNAEAKSDPSNTQSCDQSRVPLSPVIVVIQQFDESSTTEASSIKETREEVQLGTDAPSATPDSDAGVSSEVSTSDAPASPESTNHIPDSPNLSMSTLSSLQSPDVPPEECAQSDQSATPESSVSTLSSLESTDVPSTERAQIDQSATPENSVSTLSSAESTDVPPAECAQIDQSATPENSVSTLSLSESTDIPPAGCVQIDQSATPESSVSTLSLSESTDVPSAGHAQIDQSATPENSVSTLSLSESTDVPSAGHAQIDQSATPENSVSTLSSPESTDVPSAGHAQIDQSATPENSVSTLSSPESTDVPPAERVQIDQSATPENSVSTLSLSESTDVPPTECAQIDQSATPESSATPDLSTSDQETEDPASVQQPFLSSALPPCTDSPMKISLGSLSEAIGCNSATYMQTMAQQTTDRAVYLTGEIKDNWEVERVKKEKQIEAAEEKEIHEEIKEGKEETEAGEGKEEEIEGERAEGQIGGLAQAGEEPVNEGCRSSECPAESAITSSTEQSEANVDNAGKGSELETEKRIEEEEEADKRGDHTEEKGKKEKEEEVLQSAQPMESQLESVAELPLDSVAIIRELVTEITEVEEIVSPCPNSSQTP